MLIDCFMISVRFWVNSQLLVVKFFGSQSYMWIFDYAEGLESLAPALLKGQL